MLIANAQLITPSNTFDFDSRAIYFHLLIIYTRRFSGAPRGTGGEGEARRAREAFTISVDSFTVRIRIITRARIGR